MHDLKAEPMEFIADDRKEAVAKACRFFDVEESELKICAPAVGQVYGQGSRAVVVAFLPGRRGTASRDGGGGDRDRGRDRGGDRDRGDRGGRDRDRGRGRGGDRDRGRSDDRRPEGRQARGDSGRPARDPEDRPAQDSENRPARESRGRSASESKGSIRGELGVIGKFVHGVVERMVIGPFEISEETEGDFLIYQLRGDATQALGSGDGRAVDALQLLANQAAMHEFDESTRVIVDVEGDAERREAFLERLAERAAGRATETKRSVALDPMNPKDRRILHVTVRELDGVVTMSVGSGRYRQVVVVPEGAPEYEEALAAAKASERERD